MPTHLTTFAAVTASHPDAVAQVLALKAASRSKNKGIPPEELSWAFEEWAVIKGPLSFMGVLESWRARAAAPIWAPAATPAGRQVRIDTEVAACMASTHVALRAWKRSSSWQVELAPSEFPPEIEAQFRSLTEQREAAKERWHQLTPAARASEEAALLKQLTSTGFVQIKV